MAKIKKWLLKLGIYKSVLLLIGLAIIISIVLASAILLSTGGEITRPAIITTIITPGLTAAIFSIIILRLLFDLDEAENKYRDLSRTDDLTGISNRRYFLEMAERELKRAKRYGVEFAIVMFDINEFKRINDLYGHTTGDQVLQQIAQKCQKKIRNTDLIARWGGDEFVVLVSQSAKVNLDQYCSRLINIIHEIEIEVNGDPIKVTASIGTKRFSDDLATIDELIHKADRDMYQIKEENRFIW